MEDGVTEYSKILKKFPQYREFKEAIKDNHYILFTECEKPNNFY